MLVKKSLQSYLHVIIQFGSLSYVLLSGPIFPDNYLILPEFMGILIGLWSIWVMRKSVLSIFPNPEERTILIQAGPYKLIRHPMYLALYLVIIPLLIYHSTIIRLIVFIVFSINQLYKIQYEERLLLKSIPDYRKYMQNTDRLLPFVF